MKRVYLLSALCVLSITGLLAQTAKVTVTIVNPVPYKGNIFINDPLAKYDPLKRGGMVIGLDSHHYGYQVINVAVAHAVPLFLNYTLGKSDYTDKDLFYTLFLTPGDDIQIKFDLTKKDGGGSGYR